MLKSVSGTVVGKESVNIVEESDATEDTSEKEKTEIQQHQERKVELNNEIDVI